MHSIIVQTDQGETITVFGFNQLKIADSSHVNYPRIRELALNAAKGDAIDEEEFEALFDVPKAIARGFKRLTDRVTVQHGNVYFNHEPVHDKLAEQILRFLSEGEDFGPLVNFMEKVADNPSEHSRESLYSWLNDRNFTLTPEGNFIGYKGVVATYAYKEGQHAGVPVSQFTGHALVDDVEYGVVDENHTLIEGAHIPYPVGSFVEMPLPECVDNPGVECSRGLHVGTYEFARGYAIGCGVLSVEVNPRDVVSVPSYSSTSKIRVTRLRVVAEVEQAHTSPVAYDEGAATDLDEDYYGSEDPYHYSNFFTEDPDDMLDEFEDELEDEQEIPVGFATPNPAQDWFEEYVARAKRRRQPVVRYIEHMTEREGHPWKHDGEGDPKSYLSWKVSA